MRIKVFDPNYILDIKSKNGKVIRVVTHKKLKVLSKIRTTSSKQGDIQCNYGRGVTNSACYHSYDGAKQLLDDWTNKQQQEFIIGEW